MKITSQVVVTIQYTVTDGSGKELDTFREPGPLTYMHDTGNLIPGLEYALEGRQAGDRFDVTVHPDDGYGEMDPALIWDVPVDLLENIEDLEVGSRLESQTPDGRIGKMIVDAIGDTIATLNANPELAGKILYYSITVEDVRMATPEELAAQSAI